MKRFLLQALCMILIICMCFSLAGCGGRDVGGIGSIDMDDEGSGGVGILGEPGDTGDDEPTESQTPTEPTPTEPQKTPDVETFETEVYQCDMFTVTIPKGWDVNYDVVDIGNDTDRIYLFVSDPANSKNMFFYIIAMEPFFFSAEGKNAWLPYVADYYKYAPVLTDPSAEGMLRIWPSIYTFMQAEGGPLLSYFSNYSLGEVLDSGTLDGASADTIDSYVLGTVEIPSAGQYTMFFQNSLQPMNAPTGISSSGKYYISYSNFGIVLQADAPTGNFDALKACLQTLNLDGFANRK